jgi:hypothetical protein
VYYHPADERTNEPNERRLRRRFTTLSGPITGLTIAKLMSDWLSNVT